MAVPLAHTRQRRTPPAASAGGTHRRVLATASPTGRPTRLQELARTTGTFLFVVDSRVVIDAGVNGNDARYINHSCDPNCETVIEGRRVFIEALRTIQPGEELGYEYGLTWESTDDPKELANYACRCGAAACRGTMLDPVPLDKKKARKKAKAKRKVASAKSSRKTGRK
jgi:hypothetical protein